MFGLTVCIVVDNGHVSQVFVQGRKLSTCYLHTQAVFPSLLHLLRKLSHSFLTLNSYQFLFCKHHFLSKMSEKLCLQWNDFQENIKSAIGNLREDKDLQDVTLVSEDGQQVEAHKVVLASSSPFFQKLLGRNKHIHPLIYMRGVKFEDLLAIVDFLYCGEANVFQENLDSFLAIAEELQLKGLMGKSDERVEDLKYEGKAPEFYAGTKLQKASSNRETSSKKIIRTDDNTAVAIPGSFSGDVNQLEEMVKSMMEKSENKYANGHCKADRCKVCRKEGMGSAIKDHIEANHIVGIDLPCNLCEKNFRTRNALRRHKC